MNNTEDASKASYLPEGISEEKFIDIVRKVSPSSARKFLFGYHSYDDMIQKSFELAITFLTEGKFKPRGEKPMEQQLANFLRVWIYNRLNNYRRDKSCRYPNKGGSNQVKYNLMHSLQIYSQGLSNNDIFARDAQTAENASLREVVERLTTSFKKGELKIYCKYIDGNELSEAEELKLHKAVRRILTGSPEDYI